MMSDGEPRADNSAPWPHPVFKGGKAEAVRLADAEMKAAARTEDAASREWTRLECLRLAIAALGSPREVVEMAREYEAYVRNG